MDAKTLSELKIDFRQWSGGFSPGTDHEITVYVDYALSRGIDKAEAREALLQWWTAEDPNDDIYAPGERRPTTAELMRGL